MNENEKKYRKSIIKLFKKNTKKEFEKKPIKTRLEMVIGDHIITFSDLGSLLAWYNGERIFGNMVNEYGIETGNYWISLPLLISKKNETFDLEKVFEKFFKPKTEKLLDEFNRTSGISSFEEYCNLNEKKYRKKLLKANIQIKKENVKYFALCKSIFKKK